MKANFGVINSSKANFDEIYSMEDPREYFAVLGALDYMIPDIAEPVVRQILEARARLYSPRPVVLDVGCSYGINAALHRFPVNFTVLRRRYTRREVAALSSDELLRLDRNYYASWPEIGVGRFIGFDASRPAIRYAERVGLIERGIVANLEAGALAPSDAASLAEVDVILSTGSVGYVTDKTFRALLRAIPHPWIVSFVLRMFPYDALTGLFAEHGLVTERLASAVFVQRRFRDVSELNSTLEQLACRDIDTDGFESDGLLRAELFVSRPREDVEAAPLESLVTVCSGLNRPVGTRYVRLGTDESRIALEL
ncbi:MAG TPA: class I SAM-dependent methyltransferase [Gammaproteobacteria bacterium]|nr:class I SAM-dependent methyltransferase [Gammaproteobacteria bacterium]